MPLFWLSLEKWEHFSFGWSLCHPVHFRSSPSCLWQTDCIKCHILPSEWTVPWLPLFSWSFKRFAYKWNPCRSSRTSEKCTSPPLFPWPREEFSLSRESDATCLVVILQLCFCFPMTQSIALDILICMPKWFCSTKIRKKCLRLF